MKNLTTDQTQSLHLQLSAILQTCHVLSHMSYDTRTTPELSDALHAAWTEMQNGVHAVKELLNHYGDPRP